MFLLINFFEKIKKVGWIWIFYLFIYFLSLAMIQVIKMKIWAGFYFYTLK